MKESIIQQQICEYLSMWGLFYFSIPNEHYNISPAQRMSLKKKGLVPGMPDIAVLYNDSIYFLEVKNENGRLTENQVRIHERLKLMGYVVEVVRSVDDVVEFLMQWEIGTHG